MPRPYEAEALGDVSGLRLLHLQCHFGLDTLTVGAGRRDRDGPRLLAGRNRSGRDIARRAGLDDRATFVCSDVYDDGRRSITRRSTSCT